MQRAAESNPNLAFCCSCARQSRLPGCRAGDIRQRGLAVRGWRPGYGGCTAQRMVYTVLSSRNGISTSMIRTLRFSGVTRCPTARVWPSHQTANASLPPVTIFCCLTGKETSYGAINRIPASGTLLSPLTDGPSARQLMPASVSSP